jgi:TPR repeat protein
MQSCSFHRSNAPEINIAAQCFGLRSILFLSLLFCAVLATLGLASASPQTRSQDLSPRERELLGQWHESAEQFQKLNPVTNSLASKEFQELLSEEQKRVATVSRMTPTPVVTREMAEFNATRVKAESGDPQAQLLLGSMYDSGTGVQRDSSEAFRWWMKAAQKGNAVAQYNVAVMYAAGEGVEKNYTQAVEWYRKAAAQGWPDAYASLGWLYNSGRGVPIDKAEAQRLWTKGAELGSFKAKVGLAASQSRMVVAQGPGSVYYLLDNGVCCGEQINNPKEHQAYLAQLKQAEDERRKAEEKRKRLAQQLAERQAAVAAQATENPAAPRRVRGRGGIYITPSEGHWVDQVFANGEMVKLEDGSIWRISPLDTANSVNWSAASEITIDDGDELLYPYILVNTSDNELVNARLLKQ